MMPTDWCLRDSKSGSLETWTLRQLDLPGQSCLWYDIGQIIINIFWYLLHGICQGHHSWKRSIQCLTNRNLSDHSNVCPLDMSWGRVFSPPRQSIYIGTPHCPLPVPPIESLINLELMLMPKRYSPPVMVLHIIGFIIHAANRMREEALSGW